MREVGGGGGEAGVLQTYVAIFFCFCFCFLPQLIAVMF